MQSVEVPVYLEFSWWKYLEFSLFLGTAKPDYQIKTREMFS